MPAIKIAAKPGDVAYNAPNFSIKVAGGEIPAGIRQLIQSVEYESAEGMADCLRVRILDPDMKMPKNSSKAASVAGISASGGGSGEAQRIIDTKVFQPGNEISVAFGYGTELKHVGAALIRRTRVNFPSNGFPTIEVIAYTKDVVMMDNAPEKSKKEKGKGGRRFKEKKYSEAVEERAEDYGFELKVDPTPEKPQDFIQKSGLSDYDFVNGLANETGFIFWVDCKDDGKWTLHFRDPATMTPADVQEKKFTFKYNDGNFSSLLNFEPEILIQGSKTKIKVSCKDLKTGKILEVEVEEENDDAPEVKVSPSGSTLKAVDQALDGEHSTGSDIKLYLQDFAFKEFANHSFETEADLIVWAKQWFRRQRENFIMARGATIGNELLMALQTHEIKGVGESLSGDYYFSRVRHRLDNNVGYICEFDCRKVVPPMP